MKNKSRLFFSICTLLLVGLGESLSPALSAQDHYLCDEPRRPASLESQRWFAYEFPLRVYIPPVPFEVKEPEMYIPLVQAAFQSWTQAAAFATFTYVDAPQKANIVIEWKSDFQNEAAWGMAHYPSLYRSKNKILRHRSKIYLAVKAQTGTGMSVTEPVYFSYEELLLIAKHEVGHALGLNHSHTKGDIMCGGCGDVMGRLLGDITARDIQTLKYLYKLPVKIKKDPCKS